MALYHVHRPQTFKDIVDQIHITQTITNQIKRDTVAHAYLFAGPRGVGKTTTARVLAKAVNCAERKKNTAEPCNSCTSCRQISAGNAIDVMEIDAASHTGVDNVRENIIENAQFKPTASRHKVFIIDEVHMLSTASFNALLKTLEEPPAHVIFILATTEMHKLPATIISRCQTFTFKRVPVPEMVAHLKAVAKHESLTIEEPLLERIAHKSEGCVRDAVSLLDQIMALGEKTITADMVEFIIPSSSRESQLGFIRALILKQAPDGLALLQELDQQGVHINQFGQDCAALLRTMMIFQQDETLSRGAFSDHELESIRALLARISPHDVVLLTQKTLERTAQIKSAPVATLPLEMLVIEWCSDREHSGDPTEADDAAANTKISGPPKKIEVNRGETAAAQTPTNRQSIELEAIKNAWPRVIGEIESHHPSLVFILKMAELSGIEGMNILLKAAYSFHKEKLMEAKTKQYIETVFNAIYDRPLALDVCVDESAVSPADVNDAGTMELRRLASAFGGEIVS